MVTVATSQTEPNHLGFPGITRTNADDLIVTYRSAVSHQIDYNATIQMRRSSDNGDTWTGPSTLIDPTNGDPRSLTLTTLTSGQIVGAFFINATTTYETNTIRSADNGNTWDTPIRVQSDLLESTTISVEGPAVELLDRCGIHVAIVLALRGRLIGGINDSAILVASFDQGASWSDVAIVANGDVLGQSVYEPNLLRLANGDLYCGLRTQSEHLAFTVSSDLGDTWEPVTVLAHRSNGRPSVIQARNGNVIWMSRWNNRNFFQVSEDNGRTFGSVVAIGPAGARGAYSQMVNLTDGSIGAAFAMEPDSSASKASTYFARLIPGR